MKYIKTAPYLSLLLGFLALASSCQEKTQKADLIITNANIWTGNDKKNTAQSMAIVGDSIVGIGTNEEIQEFRGKATEVVDVEGGFITPGFIDSHVHLMTGGNGLLGIKLTDASTPEEVRKIMDKIADPLGTFYRFSLPASTFRRVQNLKEIAENI